MICRTLVISGLVCTVMSSGNGAEKEEGAFANAAQVAATNALRLVEEGHKVEAAQAFEVFLTAWEEVERNKEYGKWVYVDAARCYLAFGKPQKATELLRHVLMSTGKGQPLITRYLFVKSLSEQGDHKATLDALDGFDWLSENFAQRTRQEMGLLGARACVARQDLERAKRFYEKVIKMQPDSPLGKVAKDELDRMEQDAGKKAP